MPDLLLTLNSGSSSLKLGLYAFAGEATPPQLLFRGAAEHIGQPGGSLTLSDAGGKTVQREDVAHASQPEAFIHAARTLAQLAGAEPDAIGHRVVHGGPQLREHCRLTPQVLDTLRASVHYAPLHLPPALELIAAVTRLYPQTPQFACFDTAFHRTMPAVAYTYALPPRFRQQGVERYGFHGLSYESIVVALAPAVPPRMVVAHLGNGASLCALAGGHSVDTSMGMTPTGGIPMGTRTGDLDPGILLFLARTENLHSDALESLLNHDSGLKGLSAHEHSAGTADMRELEQAAAQGDPDAVLAIRIFCREIAKTTASYAAVLGGLDAIVFTGGIGEHSATVREQVCAQLAFLGVALAAAANRQHASLISAPESTIAVRVIAADEDGRIAAHVQSMFTL
jgi:acetate kinase